IKGESEALELRQGAQFLTPSKPRKQDLLEMVENAKGLGEKVMSILFAHNVVTVDEVLKRGVEGLVELPNIGPKKAEAIFELVRQQAEAEAAAAEETAGEPPEPEAVPSAAAQEETTEEELKSPEPSEETEAEPAPEPAVETRESAETEAETGPPAPPTKEEVEEEQEIPVDELSDVAPEIIEILKANDFQTLAELSITPVEELLEIEGIEEDVAKGIIEQAKQRIKNLENV
ncbi:MAG: transcription termination/antitermination protein NusA, partial [Nitrospinaceae bacterium]|nr:helix-hairpin-helix domain-containing protein [Nitrospinaceae bacterium]NIR56337.1 helix-hairpin-helix domain-containing protein [Nitrospinaceae bacterium]NIS86797.1 helix-hairpin-helix domain-containing protein [Nitrospinaceae bacterium]NIT83631.1 helix-hairpin-helix domain-containing protein [Nitrospinaceae bacterium]NIU45834.1 helix-hairpin-helix domain-containing protein [Nitrospinaceae bacterium]